LDGCVYFEMFLCNNLVYCDKCLFIYFKEGLQQIQLNRENNIYIMKSNYEYHNIYFIIDANL
jgi:hypothetical protein